MRKLFNISTEECKYHFGRIAEARRKSGSVVKTSNFISQKNINSGIVYVFNASDVSHKIIQRERIT